MMSICRTALVAVVLWPCAAFAESPAATPDPDTSNGVAAVRPEAAPPETSKTVLEPRKAPPETGKTAEAPKGSDSQRYCQNIAAAAGAARNAWQTKKLTELQGQVAKTVADLEARETELRETLARRDEALKRADTTLINIFSKMKPDAAAAQLSALDDDLAASVLQQLNPRAASAILNEISPERAMRLVNAIAGVPPSDGKKS